MTGRTVASIADARTPVAVGHGGLVGARQGDTLALFDLVSAQRRHVLGGTSAPVAAAFSPERSLVAVARQDGSIETWDTDTGQRVDVLAGTNAPADFLEFAGDGSTLLSGSLGGSIVAWDLRGDRRVVRQISRADPSIDAQGNGPDPDPSTDVQHSVPSPDGDSIARIREGPVPGQWLVQDVATGHLRDGVPTGIPVTTSHGWTPDGKHVVTVGEVPPVGVGDGTVRLWDPVTGELVAERALPFESPGGSIGWRPGGDTIFVGLMSNRGGVVELDADTLDVVGEPIRYDGHVVNVDLSPDGRLLAVSFLDFEPDRRVSVILVDYATREVVHTFDRVDATYGLEFNPDGSLLAAGGGDGLVTLIDPAARRRVGAPFEHTFVTNVAWSPDGDRLLSSSLDGTIDLWDVDRHSRIVQATPAGPESRRSPGSGTEEPRWLPSTSAVGCGPFPATPTSGSAAPATSPAETSRPQSGTSSYRTTPTAGSVPNLRRRTDVTCSVGMSHR